MKTIALPKLAAALAVDGRPRYVIAADARVAPNILSGIVSGRVTPSAEHMERLAAELRQPVAELFPSVAA